MITENDPVYNIVREFLVERGYSINGQEDDKSVLGLDSLDYLSLILYLEDKLHLVIDYNTFFADNVPEGETVESLCTRISATHTA